MTVTIMKKTNNLTARVGIFKNMDGNIPGGDFLGGSFRDTEIRNIFTPWLMYLFISALYWILL